MGRFIALLYGLVAYLVFFVSVIYATGFVSGVGVPKTIDSGPAGSPLMAIIVNLLLMTVFAVQHSVMARPQFKKWWTQFIPPAIERSTFVLFASLALLLLCWQWQPIPAVAWRDRLSFGLRLVRLGSGFCQHVPDQPLRTVRFASGRQQSRGQADAEGDLQDTITL